MDITYPDITHRESATGTENPVVIVGRSIETMTASKTDIRVPTSTIPMI